MWIIALGAGGLAALTCAAWFAFLIGRRHGRATERATANRYIHDTVLPTLEALALATPSDATMAPTRLAELRQAARAQATELRRDLAGPPHPGPLADELTILIAEFAHNGLHARLTMAHIEDGLSPHRRAALRDATREALRNTMKHGGTNRAEVHVESRDNGIAITTLDHGVGFDPSQRHNGFGITQSIMARLTEVGGRADIESRPGWGTRVRIWVPR
jgi:signal transduction histidine kinase